MTDLSQRHVLVTGAAGFLGANLVRALVARGARVHALVRPQSDRSRLADLRAEIALHGVDLTESVAVTAVMRECRPEVVFHLAAVYGHPREERERETMLRVHALGTLHLLEATREIPPPRLVCAGSSLEYGPRPHPIGEEEHLRPTTFRGVTKAAASLLCTQYGEEHGIPWCILRFFSLFGPWERPSRFIPTVVRSVLRGEEIVLCAPGTRHDFVYVEDAVEALILAATMDSARRAVFNIGTGLAWTHEEVVHRVQALAGREVPVRVSGSGASAAETTLWVADNRSARERLGWAPRFNLDEGLVRTIEWTRARVRARPPPSARERPR
jgi:nucleoside-diphosphate-sugar epimerase